MKNSRHFRRAIRSLPWLALAGGLAVTGGSALSAQEQRPKARPMPNSVLMALNAQEGDALDKAVANSIARFQSPDEAAVRPGAGSGGSSDAAQGNSQGATLGAGNAQAAAATATAPASAPTKAPAPAQTKASAQSSASAAPAPMPMPPAPVFNTRCVQDLHTIAQRTRIYFDSASASLDKRSREAAFLMASLAQGCPEARIDILGFTDPKGDPGANLTLSWRRANATLAAIKAAGFGDGQFKVDSHMQDHPDGICPHYDVVDRRVEFIVYEEGQEHAHMH